MFEDEDLEYWGEPNGPSLAESFLSLGEEEVDKQLNIIKLFIDAHKPDDPADGGQYYFNEDDGIYNTITNIEVGLEDNLGRFPRVLFFKDGSHHVLFSK